MTIDLKAPPEQFGLCSFSHKENVVSDVKWDRIAHDGYTLCLISVVCEPMRVKAIRAMLHAQKSNPSIKASGLASGYPSYGDDWYRRSSNPGNLSPDEEGYETHVHRLDYGMCHAVLITRNENFVRYLSPESLWLRLNSDRFSTPILKEWMPYVSRKLIEKRYLRECRCHRCNCGVLAVPGEAQLDEVVSEGLQRGEIAIP